MSQENNFIPEQKSYKPLGPFKLFVKSNFPFIEETFEALDNYGLYCKIVEYLNTVISNEGTVEENVESLYNAFVSLNTYVSNYFDNLDVQEEINNKLDDMVEQGTLQEIISEYLNSTAIFGYDNVESMRNATNLINGSYARTLGFYSKNDGGGSLYKIRNVTNDDVINGYNLIEMNDAQNQLVAELVDNGEINVCQIGAKGNGTDDDSEYFEFALNNYNTVVIPNKTFLINDVVTCTKSNVNIKGSSLNSKIYILSDSTLSNQLILGHGFNFSEVSNISISNLYFGEAKESKSRFSYSIRFQNSNYINISNIEVNENCGPGLFFLHCENGIIKDSYFHDTYADGIHIQRGSKYFVIENCKFYNTRDDCIGFISHGGESYGKCKNLIVSNCKMLNTLTTGSGVCCDGSENVTIQDCYITSTRLSGIRSNQFREQGETTYFYPKNIKILHNTIEDCGKNYNSYNAEGSLIVSNQGGSIDIIDNNLQNTIHPAINLSGVLGTFNIINNLISSCVRGISVTESTTLSFENCFVANIKDNICQNMSGSVVVFCTTTGTQISDDAILVNIDNNLLNNINTQSLTGNAFSLNSVKNLRFTNNVMTNAHGSNLIESSSTTFILFRNNFPRNLYEDNPYVGQKKMMTRGEPSLKGARGDVIWNWNPDSGVAFWICTTPSSDGVNAVYKPVRTDN